MGAVGAGLARLNTPGHEQAWKTGARGEERVAARLEKLLKDTGVLLLHDRAIPGTRTNIDHIAIGPGGVTTIDAKNYKGKVRTESRGGLLRPRKHHLLIGGRDKTALIEGVQRQVHVVAAAIATAGESLDVRGALCMVNTDALPLLERLALDGVEIDGPKRIAKLAARTGPLSATDIERIAATLAKALPPA